MVARSVTEASGYSPAARPRVAVAADGTLAAIAEPTRAVVLELPGGAPFAEIGIDAAAESSEVVWVGAPPRLLVLSRYVAHSTVHLIDPHGPRTIAEIRLESPMRLYASVGTHALAIGSTGAAVLSASDTHLTPYQFPSRGVPTTAGAAAGNFVVSMSGTIEEWDPHARIPKRRLRLPRPAVLSALGGSDRIVWMVSQAEPARIEVIPLVNRGQPKFHELPEPIAQVSGHPRSDLLVCIGAETGKVYVVDLDGRTRTREPALDPIDRAEAATLVVGRLTGVLAAQAGKRVAIVSLDGRDLDLDTQVTSRPKLTAPGHDEPKRSSLGHDDEEDLAPPPEPEPEPPPPRPAPPPPRPVPRPSVLDTAIVEAPPPAPTERFSGWRDRIRQAKERSDAAPAVADATTTWRDDLVAWIRAADRTPPSSPPIDWLAARLELPAEVVPVLALLYGSHLAGLRGAAPVDVARVLGRRWDEALGTGQLAARGLARYVESRVWLAGPLQRALDELLPATGTLVGVGGEITLIGPCAVVDVGTPLAVLAVRYVRKIGGAILAAHDDAEPLELFVEARARGAVPMLRIATGEVVELGTDPAVLVVPDEVTVEQLGVPLL